MEIVCRPRVLSMTNTGMIQDRLILRNRNRSRGIVYESNLLSVPITAMFYYYMQHKANAGERKGFWKVLSVYNQTGVIVL